MDYCQKHLPDCQKHLPKKPVIVKNKYPCKCQGLCLMKEFVKKNQEKCKALKPDKTSKIKMKFETGSKYEGDWITSTGCMHGHGVYTFPNGVVYEGEFKYGSMHGQGELRYQTVIGQAIVRGKWTEGVLSDRKIFFDDDTLEHAARDWQYCKLPDRRFSKEYADGLQPGGRSHHTAYQPTIEVPEDCFDTGDGFYDRKRQAVYTYNDLSVLVRRPSHYERNWIIQNCRSGEKDSIGPRPDLYETYLDPAPLLEPEPEPAVNYTRKPQTSPSQKDHDILRSKVKEKEKSYGKTHNKLMSTLTDSTMSMLLN